MDWAVVGVTYISSELGCLKPKCTDWVLNSIFVSRVSIQCLSYQQVLTLNRKINKSFPQSSALPVNWRSNTLIWLKGLCRIGTANTAHGKRAVLKMRGKIDGPCCWVMGKVTSASGAFCLGGHLRPQLLQETLWGRYFRQHWGSLCLSIIAI